jgi:hypothetical protein
VFKKKSAGKLKWFISIAAEKFYRQAIASASAEAYFVGDKPLNFLGIDLTVIEALPDSVMVVADSENLWFGTDLMSDFEDIQVLNMKDTTGDKNVRFIASMKLGVNYGNPTEIVYYG